MKRLFLLLLVASYAQFSFAQKNAPDPSYHLITGPNGYVQYKNYYLLTLFQELPAVRKLIKEDPILKTVLSNKQLQISAALKNCATDVGCYTQALKFSENEISTVSQRLAKLFESGTVLKELVSRHLVPSGCYSLYTSQGPEETLLQAWAQDAKAVNYAIAVYAEGKKPNYPKIDSISFNIKDKAYPELLATSAGLSISGQPDLFFEPSMTFALQALEMNERNDAADYEPMATTVNKAALIQIKKTNWPAYRYSLILVPGEGPEESGTELSAGGMLRCRLAALQYKKGLAPFIMVSGGRVHPYKTKYSEAYEMKKFLMHTLHIPESAILMEPHARHTTTNMRNAARLMFRYGFPMDKAAITSTSKSQSYYISELVPERSKKELGYLPYKNGKRLSDTELEFYPGSLSLQIDFDEPLDP